MKRIKQMVFGAALLFAAASPELMGTETAEATVYCSKEQCSVARMACRDWCPFPCAMQFECTMPYCGSCISCSC